MFCTEKICYLALLGLTRASFLQSDSACRPRSERWRPLFLTLSGEKASGASYENYLLELSNVAFLEEILDENPQLDFIPLNSNGQKSLRDLEREGTLRASVTDMFQGVQAERKEAIMGGNLHGSNPDIYGDFPTLRQQLQYSRLEF